MRNVTFQSPGLTVTLGPVTRLRLCGLVLVLSLGSGCGGSGLGSPGSSAAAIDFCHSMVDELVAAITRCSDVNPDLAWRDTFTGLCDEVDGMLAAGTLTYDRASRADCLTLLSQLACIGTGPPESCTNAIAGRLPTGSECSLLGIGLFSECAPGNYCGYAGNACGGTCRPYLQPGGSCAYTDAGGFPQCASGSSCQSGLCVPDAGWGQPCLGSIAGGCGDGLYCNLGTCHKRKTSGTCGYGGECAAGYICAGPAYAKACTKAKLPGDSCTQNQSECYGLSFCGGNGKCSRTGVAENQPCGNLHGEYIQCGTDLYCDLATGAGCQKKKPAGSNCFYWSECAGNLAYCDSTTYLCVACGGSTPTGGATGMGGAGGAGATGGATGFGGTASTGGVTSGGGLSSTGGSSTSAGGTVGAGLPTATACPKPTTPLITDFTYTPMDAAAPPTEVTFGDLKTTFSGGTYVYPDGTAVPQPAFSLISDMTGSNWHISGMVATYSGFGLYWNACALLDASAFKGISMTISGTIPAPNTLTIVVGTEADTISTSWYAKYDMPPITPTFGNCIPPGSNQFDGSCTSPSRAIPVTATPTTVILLWADLTGGKPQPSVTPSQLTAISFYFSYSGTTAAYPVDITIDDLSFVP